MEGFEMPSFTKIGEFSQLLVDFIKELLDILSKIKYGFVGYPKKDEEN